MSWPRPKKTTKGKQKIEIKRIEDEDARYISFSKRRNGVFAKASDISTLCGADLAILINSPTGRPHTFGSPAVEPVVERVLSGGAAPPPGMPAEQAYQQHVVQSLSRSAMQIAARLEAGKARRAELEEREAAAYQGIEWMKNMDTMALHELDRMKELLEHFKIRMDGMLAAHLQAGAEAGRQSAMIFSNAVLGGHTAAGDGGYVSASRPGWMLQPSSSSNPFMAVNPSRMVSQREPAGPASAELSPRPSGGRETSFDDDN
ncbi:hypothetical protein Cni_G08291 [Canna indica]|uniref:MADS-box domain-containing protein n=1 Tax=Canna indica TaxID=4628 RepID=A0AAQ3Q8H6_9LILI|nr:hypothetical protein Cni_G08291 [Canna indica]